MLTRRVFATCAICSAISGLTATAAEAPANSVTRTMLQKTDLPGDRYVTLLMQVDIAGDFHVPRHTHPGVESTYVQDGGGELSVKDQATRALKAGEGFQVPAVVPHAWKNGPAPTRLIVTYVVEKDKPLVTLAPE